VTISAEKLQPDGPGFDAGGKLAAAGQPIDDVYERVMSAPYFRAPPPKSTDVPAMLKLFLDACGEIRKYKLPDLLATAGCIASMAVGIQIDKLPKRPDEVMVSGGGSHNEYLIEVLGATYTQYM